MKKILVTAAFLAAAMAMAQVGINNSDPKATLDVTAKTTDGSKPEGIIAPRLTGDQIKSGDLQYDTPQIGTIVYATAAVGTSTPKTINITTPGYYYFDNTLVWQKFTGAAATGNFWDLLGNTGTTPPNTAATTTATNTGVNPLTGFTGSSTIPNPIAATVGSSNFIGTKDTKNLAIGVGGITRAIFNQKGSLYGGAGTDDGLSDVGNVVPDDNIGSLVWGSGNELKKSSVGFPASFSFIFGRLNSSSSNNTNIAGFRNTIGDSSVNTSMNGNRNYANFFQNSFVTGINNSAIYSTAAGGIGPTPSVATIGAGGNFVTGNSNTLTGTAYPTGMVVGGLQNTVPVTVNNIALFGTLNNVSSDNTLVAGKGNTVNTLMTNAAVVGTYNTPVDNSLFIVGNGTSGATQNNALVVLNNGNVGLGANNNAPTNTLHVNATNPVRLEGLQAGAATDNVIVADATGVLKTVPAASLGGSSSTEPWYNVATNTGATANTQNIYQMGNVGIGTNAPQASLHVTSSTPYSTSFFGTQGVSVGQAFFMGNNSSSGAIYLKQAASTVTSTGVSMWTINSRVNTGGFTIQPYNTDGITPGTENFSLLPNGNLGLGNINPQTRLHITNATAGAISIEDGTQQAGRVLTSDANGVGTWQAPSIGNQTAVVKFTGNQTIADTSVTGASASKEILPGTVVSSSITGLSANNNGELNLPAGKYMIFVSHDISSSEYCIFKAKINDTTDVYTTYYGEWLNTSFIVDMPTAGFVSFYSLGLLGSLNPNPTFYVQNYANIGIQNTVTVLKLN